MRVRLINLLGILFLLFACSDRRGSQDLNSFKIILFDSSDRNVRLMNDEIYSDSSFNYRIEGYGHPNVYVVLIHSHLDEILDIKFSNLEKGDLIDMDTLGFNDWFNVNENEEIYMVFKEDYKKFKDGKNRNKRIKLYEIDVLARSME